MKLFRCTSLPDVSLLELKPKLYVANLQHVIGHLKGCKTILAAWKATRPFVIGDTAELKTAALPLDDALVYTHFMRPRVQGRPTCFVTMEGVRTLLKTLPPATAAMRRNFEDLLSGRFATFAATEAQAHRDEGEEIMGDFFIDEDEDDVARSLWNELLYAKDEVIRAKDQVIRAKDAEITWLADEIVALRLRGNSV